MAALFIFGTLQHPPLLDAVLGRDASSHLREAKLPGFRVDAVATGAFPMISKDPDARAVGMVIDTLTDADVERLDYYEAAFGYSRDTVKLADGTLADCYLPSPGRWAPAGNWSLQNWAREWGPVSVLAAEEAMTYLGQKSPQDVSEMFPMIRARAWSRLNAAQSLHGARTLDGKIDIQEHRRPYSRYFAVEEFELKHERFDGSMSVDVLRAVFRAPDAALVLPYDPLRDTVLVVEQVRMGPLARGDRVLWQLEPIAGRLDPGEDPETAARREAREEAGLELGALSAVAQTYSSPGNSSEFYYIYVGLAELPETRAGFGGLDAENEDIRSHVLTFDELMDMCAALEVANAPLVIAAYWLAHNRKVLRAAAGIEAAAQ